MIKLKLHDLCYLLQDGATVSSQSIEGGRSAYSASRGSEARTE